MLIGVAAETDPAETRVAATPETVKKFIALGAEVAVERGAGIKAGVPDAEYEAAGARLVSDAEALGADVVLKVRRPDPEEIGALKSGALVVGAWTRMVMPTPWRRSQSPARRPSRWSSCRASRAPR